MTLLHTQSTWRMKIILVPAFSRTDSNHTVTKQDFLQEENIPRLKFARHSSWNRTHSARQLTAQKTLPSWKAEVPHPSGSPNALRTADRAFHEHFHTDWRVPASLFLALLEQSAVGLTAHQCRTAICWISVGFLTWLSTICNSYWLNISSGKEEGEMWSATFDKTLTLSWVLVSWPAWDIAPLMVDLWPSSPVRLGKKPHLYLQPFHGIGIGKACWGLPFLQSRYLHLQQEDGAHIAHGFCGVHGSEAPG